MLGSWRVSCEPQWSTPQDSSAKTGTSIVKVDYGACTSHAGMYKEPVDWLETSKQECDSGQAEYRFAFSALSCFI